MTNAGKSLTHRGGNVVVRTARRDEKTRPGEVSSYQLDAGRVLEVCMSTFATDPLRGYDRCMVVDQLTVCSGGGGA